MAEEPLGTGKGGVRREEHSLIGAGGVQIQYDVVVPRTPSDTPPRAVVVLCHGYGEHGRRFADVATRLTEIGIAVVIPDHRGHGRSGGKRAYLTKWADFLTDVDRVVDAARERFGAVPLIMLGHSMGGAIALTYTLDHPGKVSALALSAPAVVVDKDVPAAIVLAGRIVALLAPSAPVQKLDADAVSSDPDVVAAYKADPLVRHKLVPAGLARELIAAGRSALTRVSELTGPVLLLHGTGDKLADVSGSQRIADGAVNADVTLHLYPGLAHEVFNEPEKEQVLGDFLAWTTKQLN